MVELSQLLTADRILLDVRCASKRQLFQDLAQAAARETGLAQPAVLAALLQREKLGTTGIGEGIAIPHARVSGLADIIGMFVRLATPVDYDALDDEPVDLVFLLLAPEGSTTVQLKALAKIARLLREPAMTAQLRAAGDVKRLHALLVGGRPLGAA